MAGTASTGYLLLTTTRFDPLLTTFRWNNDPSGSSPFLLLTHHLSRLIQGAETLRWEEARRTLEYDQLKKACVDAVAEAMGEGSMSHSGGAYRIRITLSRSGFLDAVASSTYPFACDPTAPAFFIPTDNHSSFFGPSIDIRLDSDSTPTSTFTTTKTTNRTHYDRARTRSNIPSLSNQGVSAVDVLLYNSNQHIMETSIFNVAFHRAGFWITPAKSTGCLPGVLRRWLLEEGRIREDVTGVLTTSALQAGEWILLFNGSQGCRLGRLIDLM